MRPTLRHDGFLHGAVITGSGGLQPPFQSRRRCIFKAIGRVVCGMSENGGLSPPLRARPVQKCAASSRKIHPTNLDASHPSRLTPAHVTQIGSLSSLPIWRSFPRKPRQPLALAPPPISVLVPQCGVEAGEYEVLLVLGSTSEPSGDNTTDDFRSWLSRAAGSAAAGLTT